MELLENKQKYFERAAVAKVGATPHRMVTDQHYSAKCKFCSFEKCSLHQIFQLLSTQSENKNFAFLDFRRKVVIIFQFLEKIKKIFNSGSFYSKLVSLIFSQKLLNN